MTNQSQAGQSKGWGHIGAAKAAIVVALVVLVAAVIYLKRVTRQDGTEARSSGLGLASTAESVPATKTVTSHTDKPLPRLVDLGAGKCIPCKMMAPILEELKVGYQGRLEVDFIDVWENPAAGKAFRIQLIPTQIFYDPSGKELFRHEGFMSREDILAKWKELGYDLGKGE